MTDDPLPIVRVKPGAMLAAFHRWGRVTVYQDGKTVAYVRMAMAEIVVYRYKPGDAPKFKGALVDVEA
jgi:hypothetical protein